MIISSVRFIKERAILHPLRHRYGSASVVLFSLVLLSLLLTPEFINISFAEDEPVSSDRSLNVTLTSTNTDPTQFNTIIQRHDATKSAFFSTLTINATVSATSTTGTEEGYTLAMRSLSPGARLYRDHKNPNLLNYIDSITEPFSFNLDSQEIASSNKFLSSEINKYGYSLDWTNDSSTSKTFHPIPTTDTVVRQTKSGEESDTTQITFGFGINHDMMSGTYYGEIEFTAIGNILSNTKTFYILTLEPGDATTPEDYIGEIKKTTDTSTSSQDFILGADPKNPSLITEAGEHTFLGYNETPAFKFDNQYYQWNESLGRYVATDLNIAYKYENDSWSHFDGEKYSSVDAINVNTTDKSDFIIEYDENGKIKSAHQTFTKNLYAVWEQPAWDAAFMISGALAQKIERASEPNTFDSYFKMQDMSKNICEIIPNSQDIISSLIDSRDNHIYGVIKAKDGNCWMTDNLALGSDISDKTYYYNTTNIADSQNVIIPKSNEYKTPENSAPYADWASAYNSDSTPALFAYDSLVDINHGTKYGNYYSYYLAMANLAHTGDNTKVNTTSICPKGWIVPSLEYATLANFYDNILDSPLNFRLGGKVVKYEEDNRDLANRTSMLYQGQYGMYWTSLNSESSANTITSEYDINAGTSALSARVFVIDSTGHYNETATNHRGNGLSVRCISEAVNNFNLHFDGNGGTIDTTDMYISNSSSPATATFTLSANSDLIPHRDRVIEDYIFDNIHYYYRHDYVFLGWHSTPTLASAPASVSAARELIDYDFADGKFTPATVVVDKEHDNYSKILYAIWLDNRTLDHTENVQGEITTPEQVTTTSTVKNEDNSDSSYVKPYGEDTIDDNIPSKVLEVVKLIRALPNPTLVTLSHAEQITAVREAYEALTNSEKALIGDALTNKYNEVLSAYYSILEADTTGSNILIAAIVGAAVSTLAFTTFIIIKKEKDEDDEEE